MLRKRTVLAAVLLAAFTGCTTAPEALQSLGDRNYMRYATGKPYAQIASQSQMSVEGLAGATIYGPMIGEYRLVDGDTVYRHIDNVESTRTGVNAGLLMQRESVGTRYRLAYFRVGPDGVVKDWATGALPGERLGCTWYAGGFVQQCSSETQRLQSLAVYDSLVRTSSDMPLPSWGTPIAGAQQPKPADQNLLKNRP
ncbi:hypothetical protein [Mesorhizobium sp. 1M-11]|uniref:hypothetical protein n=1 Tax=Mesorhizobium sp. 1M-11 TaxID=1529006 RepID=UPI0006C77018|nr:hypothetical protein [Mesorhizobium sp. 1M-11]